MHFQYKFSNLLGTVYRKGDLVFSKDGNSIFVPVGNKITCYDLRNSRSYTLPLEVEGNFMSLALSPNGLLLIGSTDTNGLHMIGVMRRRLLYSTRTKKPVTSIVFSPDGKYFAAAEGSLVRVYRCGGMEKRVFNPFNTEKVCDAASAEVTCINWSFDSRLLVFGSRDMLTRVFPIKLMDIGAQVAQMSGSSSAVVAAYFQENCYDLYTVNKSGIISNYECLLKPEGLKEKTLQARQHQETIRRILLEADADNTKAADIDAKKLKENLHKTWLNYCRRHNTAVSAMLHTSGGTTDVGDDAADAARKLIHVSACCYHPSSQVLVVACKSGDFAIIDMKDGCSLLQSLNISSEVITSVAMNLTGDWVALGVSSIGQLLVWELRSETYVLKQQGHYNSMNVVAYSPDAACLASGGEDGKVKLWSTVSSFCYVTFSEHTAAVTGLSFTQSGRAVLSSSLDGTVRAFDLVRYRNFKTLTSPRATQFTCLAVDSSGELVAAGGQDSHQIYLWSLKLGSLLEVLSGHTGPVSSISFSPVSGSSMLASTAWDRTLKLWDSISTTQARETVRLQSDGICVSIRPDGQQVCVSTMDGHLTLFNCATGAEEGCIEGRRDMGLSRGEEDEITAEKSAVSKFYQSLCYSSDGQQILAGGSSKFVCIYSAAQQLLLKKYVITQNSTYDGMSDIYDPRTRAHNGVNMCLVEQRGDVDDVKANRAIKLPGVKKGDKSLRAFRPEIRVTDIAFAPTGRSFVVCCTEGLLVYSQDTDWLFDPLSLDIDNTPAAVRRKIGGQEWGLALMMAIRLNIDSIKQEALESIPEDAISVVVSGLPALYVEGLMAYLAAGLEATRHVGLYARWTRQVLFTHGTALKGRAPQIVTTINALHRALNLHYTTLNKLCAANEYTLSYLRRQAALRKHVAKAEQDKVQVMANGGEAPPSDGGVSDGSEDMASDEESQTTSPIQSL